MLKFWLHIRRCRNTVSCGRAVVVLKRTFSTNSGAAASLHGRYCGIRAGWKAGKKVQYWYSAPACEKRKETPSPPPPPPMHLLVDTPQRDVKAQTWESRRTSELGWFGCRDCLTLPDKNRKVIQALSNFNPIHSFGRLSLVDESSSIVQEFFFSEFYSEFLHFLLKKSINSNVILVWKTGSTLLVLFYPGIILLNI